MDEFLLAVGEELPVVFFASDRREEFSYGLRKLHKLNGISEVGIEWMNLPMVRMQSGDSTLIQGWIVHIWKDYRRIGRWAMLTHARTE